MGSENLTSPEMSGHASPVHTELRERALELFRQERGSQRAGYRRFHHQSVAPAGNALMLTTSPAPMARLLLSSYMPLDGSASSRKNSSR